MPVTCGGAPSRRSAPSSPTSTTAYQHVDAATIFLVTDPGRFDVIVTDNLFGDILTDLAAAIAGGIGLAASGQHQPRPHDAEHVRARPRLGPRHRRPGQGRPDRGDPLGRACCSTTSASTRTPRARRARRRRRPRRARRRRPQHHRASATPSPRGSDEARLRRARRALGTYAAWPALRHTPLPQRESPALRRTTWATA